MFVPFLGSVMVGVVLLSRKCHINPDNVATPIAASLGDLTTISLLAAIAMGLFNTLGELDTHKRTQHTKRTHIICY